MNLFTPNLQFTLNASPAGAPSTQFPLTEIVRPGSYMNVANDGDSLQTNVTLNQDLSNISVVYITKNTMAVREAFINFYDAGNELAGSVQFFGTVESGDRRLGAGTADFSLNRRFTNNHYGTEKWEVVAASMGSPAQANKYSLISVGGVDSGNGTGNGTATTTPFPDTTNLPIHIGWPGSSSYTGNNSFDVAMVRIYKRILTLAQTHDIYDHWVDNNEAYYTNNSESVPTHADGAVDYTTDLFAEWDFAKMPAGVLQTTQGSVGLVTASLTGNAVVTV